MMEMTIKITGLEGLEAALNRLADAVSGAKTAGAASAPVSMQPAPVGAGMVPPQYQSVPQTPATPVIPIQPTMQQYQPPQTQPAAPQAPTMPMVPTSHVAQAYTQSQMAVALTSLVDAGKLLAVQAILQQFGITSLMEISPDRYPELAVRLREAGAAI